MSPSDEPLVPTFIPSLVSTLLNRERAKGSPLTEEEVIKIRDSCAVVMSPASIIPAMVKSRGYEDIDPEHCWEHWCVAREQLVAAGVKTTAVDEGERE